MFWGEDGAQQPALRAAQTGSAHGRGFALPVRWSSMHSWTSSWRLWLISSSSTLGQPFRVPQGYVHRCLDQNRKRAGAGGFLG